jgi:NADH dehydrogenase
MSANGADGGRTPYFQAKREMEAAVRASGLAWTIFRPSYVSSAEKGSFDEEFARIVDKAPLLPSFEGGRFEIQPVSREDVALAFARALDEPRAIGRTLVLVGPERFTWNEYLRRLARIRGRKARLVDVPPWLALAAATLLGPLSPASPDELRMLMEGSVGDPAPARELLALPMVPWEDAVAGLRR